jgi:hypothetical protein
VDYCPIFIYGNILTEAEIKLVSAQIQWEHDNLWFWL